MGLGLGHPQDALGAIAEALAGVVVAALLGRGVLALPRLGFAQLTLGVLGAALLIAQPGRGRPALLAAAASWRRRSAIRASTWLRS